MSYHGTAASGFIFYSTNDADLVHFDSLSGDISGGIHTVNVDKLKGIALPTGAPLDGQIIKYNLASGQFVYSPDESGLNVHNLLGVYHGDTEPSSPTRGSLIYGSGASTKWASLPLGTQGFVPYSDGLDVLYTQLGAVTPFSSGSVASPSVTFVGDLNTGWSSPLADTLVASAGGSGLLRLNGITNTLNVDGGYVSKTRTLTSSAVLSSADYVVVVNQSGEMTVTLPSGIATGQTIIVKDSNGAAAGNNIIIQGSGSDIDGNSFVRIKNNYGSFTFLYNGSQWNVI